MLLEKGPFNSPLLLFETVHQLTPRLPLHSDFGNKGYLNGPSSLATECDLQGVPDIS